MARTLFIATLLFSCFFGRTQSSTELASAWKYFKASAVSKGGLEISKTSFNVADWKPAVVPGTVLTSMLQNKEVPDPFYGMNNEKIPDIYQTGKEYYTYWFVRDFDEKMPTAGQQVWLNFRGVNYSCDVFLNGSKLNDSTHHGMFLRQSYNITKLLNKSGKNRVAVIVYPPDPVGNPNGGQGGDGMIAKNVTHQYVAGWDWIQPIRDRNTGIWDKVTIERTGAVRITNPHVVTRVPGLRSVEGKQAPATIDVGVELQNTSGSTITGTVEYQLAGAKTNSSVTLKPYEKTIVKLPQHVLQNPKLWWPNGYGQQNLYDIVILFRSGNAVSDRDSVRFGVRELQTEWNTTTRSRQISVNGQKIFIKGGNWIVSDQMLRLSNKRYDAEVRFHRDMNLNLIRVWGGALLERPEFYEACDRYGLLVFQDFWMTGDCNGRWNDRMKAEDRATRRKYPDDHELFLTSVRDQVKMIRNHASLAIWCGGNEITPPQDILAAIRDTILPELDGTRWFVDASTSDSMSLNTIGGGGDGPYNIQPKDTFWKHRTYPFNSEVGSVGVGDYVSLQRFIPAANLVPPIYIDTSRRNAEKVDSVWQYHKYIGYSKYILPYGVPSDARDFAVKAQFVNYDQYRSLMEGFSSRMWDWYTGVIIWKTQNPWTALRGQMYDYYLDPNACLYGLRSGGEPIHIMYNPVDGTVMFANNKFKAANGLRYTVDLVSMEGTSKSLGTGSVSLDATSTTKGESYLQQVDAGRGASGCFLNLKLSGPNNELLSENLYWLPDSSGSYSGLQNLNRVQPTVTVRKISSGKLQVTLRNNDQQVAFFNRISVIDSKSKQRLLPAFFSDNYVSVLPGQQKTITVEYPHQQGASVHVEGWNVKEMEVGIGNEL